MAWKMWRFGLALSLVPVVLVALAGCGNQSKTEGPERRTAKVDGQKGHDHSAWWCDEHGVPEEVCTRCNSKLVKKFKDEGDWCKKHNRPDSQCFICHPEKEAEWAAKYEAKYGKQPPKPEPEPDETKKG
jgi:cobalt-zinc-cadmium efflux system membrane fusion protein